MKPHLISMNCQNYIYWSPENVHIYGEKAVDLSWLMARCRMSSRSFFFKKISGPEYLNMLQVSTVPAICQLYGNKGYFQQDEAPPHYHLDVGSYLDETVTGQCIRWRVRVQYPVHSLDLTPLDFHLWRYLQDEVYHSKSDTLEELQEESERSCTAMPVYTFLDICKSSTKLPSA